MLSIHFLRRAQRFDPARRLTRFDCRQRHGAITMTSPCSTASTSDATPGTRGCAQGLTGRAADGSTWQSPPRCERKCVLYSGKSYDARVPRASFCVNGSQGHLLVTRHYPINTWLLTYPHAKRLPRGRLRSNPHRTTKCPRCPVLGDEPHQGARAS